MMRRIWWRALLITILCGALFLLRRSSAKRRRPTTADCCISLITPLASAAILGGLAYTSFVRPWDRWIALVFTLCAGISFLSSSSVSGGSFKLARQRLDLLPDSRNPDNHDSDDEIVWQRDCGAAEGGIGRGQQIGLRTDAHELRRLDQAVEQRRDLGAAA